MVLLNMYGKIEPTTISEKLGVGICNPTSDWVEGFLDDFTEEILVFNHNIATYKRDGYDVSWADGRFDLDHIVEQFGWYENGKKAAQIIAEHLIEIQVSDFDNSLLQIKNPYIDSPTCEPQYTRKFLNFCCRVQSSKSSQKIIPNQIPFSTYNSDEWNTKPLILNHVAASLHMEYKDGFSNQVYTDGGIASLKYIGKLIDNFLVTEKDFWLLDYIINAVFSDSDFNAYHVFKTMSLIEMLIIDSKDNGKTIGAMEKKLPQFLPERIPREKATLFSSIARKLRNKIGHGDFEAVQLLLEQYRDSFMKDFWYDEYEHSVETWTYGNLCLILDDALNEILWLMLSNRNQLIAIQNDK